MLEADRIFLRDFTSVAFKSHLMTVEALLQASMNSKQSAVRCLRREDESLSEEEAVAFEQQLDEGDRFHSVMVAKLFGEFAAAAEDFGALCFAIRNREPNGILSRYLGSQPREVCSFFDHVLEFKQDGFSEILSLPAISEIRDRIDAAMLPSLEEHYTEGAAFIARIATAYRAPPNAAVMQTLANLRSTSVNHVHLMIDAPGAPPQSTRGLLPHVYNKIKHRFMLVESEEAYAQLPTAAQYKVVAIAKTREGVDELVQAVKVASLGSGEIAATLLGMDEDGIAL